MPWWIVRGATFSYDELAAEIDAVALGLAALGVAKGDRVGIWAPNCAEWVLVQYATAKLGAILVNINPAFQSHELAFVLKHSGLRTLVAAANLRGVDCAAMIAGVRGDCPKLRDVVLIGGREWSALIAGGRRADHSLLPRIGLTLSPDDPINIQYTSGTTGFPKGATLSHHNILNNGYFVGELCGYTEADLICLPGALLPLFRNGDGQLGGHESRRVHGDPRARVRCGGHVGRGRGRTLHLAVWGPDDVHRRTERPVVCASTI